MADFTPTTPTTHMEQAFGECLASLDAMTKAELALQFACCGDTHNGLGDPAVADWEDDVSGERGRLHLAFELLFNIPATSRVEALFSNLGYAIEAVVLSELPDEYGRMRAYADVGFEMAPILLGSEATEGRMGLVSEGQRLVAALARLDHYRGPDDNGAGALVPA